MITSAILIIINEPTNMALRNYLVNRPPVQVQDTATLLQQVSMPALMTLHLTLQLEGRCPLN